MVVFNLIFLQIEVEPVDMIVAIIAMEMVSNVHRHICLQILIIHLNNHILLLHYSILIHICLHNQMLILHSHILLNQMLIKPRLLMKEQILICLHLHNHIKILQCILHNLLLILLHHKEQIHMLLL